MGELIPFPGRNAGANPTPIPHAAPPPTGANPISYPSIDLRGGSWQAEPVLLVSGCVVGVEATLMGRPALVVDAATGCALRLRP